MFKIVLSVFFCTSMASAKIYSAGAKSPVELPNGRSGATSIATYQNMNEVAFELTASSSVMIFTTTDLYLKGCSATGVAERCGTGEANSGNQKLVIIHLATNRVVQEEIFKYGLSSGAVFDASVIHTKDKVAIRVGANTTSTIHMVSSNLPAGRYLARLQVRNDFNPMFVHSKSISVISE